MPEFKQRNGVLKGIIKCPICGTDYTFEQDKNGEAIVINYSGPRENCYELQLEVNSKCEKCLFTARTYAFVNWINKKL